jgi:conjugative relaxase-like TrwC/TraI family protein
LAGSTPADHKWGGLVAADLHKLAVGREHYYTREIARNREEYLSGHGESPGIYHGGAAAALGLEGECSPEAFKRLFGWQDPRTGQQLGRGPRADVMPAWDLVFRPHKDVSVLYALGDQHTGAAVAEAHQAGVRAAIAYLDEQVGTRTGRHGADHVQGSGLLAVGFTHRTSRAGDPLLHTYLIIANRTRGPDGQWRTLDSRDLLNHRATADAMYRAAYQHELTRSLGVLAGAGPVGQPRDHRDARGAAAGVLQAARADRRRARPPRSAGQASDPRGWSSTWCMRPGRRSRMRPRRRCMGAGSRRPARLATSPTGWSARSPR